MFHSVGLRDHAWCWRHLSEPVEAFEAFLDLLAREGFRTIGLAEVQAHMRGDTPDLKDAIALTFDDGYLDNWVYVAPLLRKRGMKGTVFVNPDFVDPRELVRPTLEDAWAGRVAAADLAPAGFMSWEELRLLDREGVLDVQSHAMTHTWHFTGPDIVGWHRGEPLSPWPWMAWNARPDRKPFYLTEDQSGFVQAGHPVFAHRQALVARRFFPDEGLLGELSDVVRRDGGRFFTQPGWQERLLGVIRDSGDDTFPGALESEAEHQARVRRELGASRELIGRQLGKSVDFICWPAGGSDAFCEAVARECGYAGWTLPARQAPSKRNRPGADPVGIKRMDGQRRAASRGGMRIEGGTGLQRLQVQAHRGSSIHAALARAYRAAAAAGLAGRPGGPL